MSNVSFSPNNQLGHYARCACRTSSFASRPRPRRYVALHGSILALLLAFSHVQAGPLNEADSGQLFGYTLGETYLETETFALEDVRSDGYVMRNVRYHRSPQEFDEIELKLTPLSHTLVGLVAISQHDNRFSARDCVIKYVAKLRREYREWEGGIEKARGNEREDYIVLKSKPYWISVVAYRNKCTISIGYDSRLNRKLYEKAQSELAQMKAR